MWLPVIKGMENDYLEGDERASAGGPVDARITFNDWLKTQDDATIKDILGPTRFAMFKNGTPINSFVENGATLTIEQLMKKEGWYNIPTGGRIPPNLIPPVPPSGGGDDEGRRRYEQWVRDNERRAREAADRLFPGEKWSQKDVWGDRIFVAEHKPTGTANFNHELRDAQILRNAGGTVYLVPEPKTDSKKYDSITNGLQVEYKNITGGAGSLHKRFFESREQAPNVFINLEDSKLTEREIISTLRGARNSAAHRGKNGKLIRGYNEWNKFPEGGTIILKMPNMEELIYIDVDSLKV
jgi:hypothetical protein